MIPRTPISAAGARAPAASGDQHVARSALALVLVVAMLFGLRAAGVAGAAGLNFVVNDTSDRLDASVGDGLCRTSAGTCSLRAAIQETNAQPGADVVQLPSGIYEIGIPPLNQNDVTTGDLDITDSLTISGAGAAATFVDGGNPRPGAPPQVHGLDRLFEVLVDGGRVVFSDLTIREGYAAEFGGAIANNSTATIEITGSTLTGNVAGKTGGAIDNHVGGTVHVLDSTLSDNYATESGSALNNNRDGTVTLANVTVSANSAAAVGLDETLSGAGAIGNNAELDARGTITVTGSRFTDNSAGGGRSGAAISNDGAGIVTVHATTFAKNRAAANGGAIFNNNGEVTVTESTFSENEGKDGGALYSTGVGVVTLNDSTFTLNGAVANGGALGNSGTSALSVTNGMFSKNSAEDSGGAVSNADKGSIAILDSSFTENSGLNGGGFSNEGAGLVTVESSTFTKNRAIVTILAVSGEGGGMHSNSGGEVVIAASSFIENSAGSGGGLANEGGGQMTITGSRFATNTADEAGGGIHIQSGAVRMVDIDVIGNVANSALEGGGGIAYEGDKAVALGESAALESSRIRNNKSNGDGGGIDSRGDGPLAITTTVIAGNTSLIGGAIHHVGDAPLLVDRSALSGNVAANGGGVFTDGDGEAEIENTTVSGNRAGEFGGGVLVSSRLTIRNSTVSNNNAPSGGGINNGGGDLVGDGTVFLANTIVANNPTGGNCAGTMTSRGGNLDNGNSCAFRELSDQPGTNPRLGPLADNGGPTQTHALLAGSPAQEKAFCTEPDPCPTVDQRGAERPRFSGFDAGAYESELPPEGGGGEQCASLTERPVPADYDSWVSQSSQSANFGSDAILNVSGNARALVHFTLPPVPPGCKLIAATLRLYSTSATDGRTLQALRIASSWSELGVTWGNQPGAAGPAATTLSGLNFREWDVLAQTRDMYSLGDHGFLIRDAAESGNGSQSQSFHSREKGTDRPPELILVFDDPDAPPLPGSCPTTPQSLSADRDSWVSESSPTNNFGNDSTLKIKSQTGSNSRVLVRFPLPVLPAGCTSIASALLRMDASSAKEGHTLGALQIASSWTETGVTWANQPATTGPAANVPSAQGVLEWSVTHQILGMYTSANHGFLVRDAVEDGVGDEQTLNSRDKLNDGPPELVLVFDDSTPETTIGLGPGSPTEKTDARFIFSSDRDDATFECSLDGAAFQACTSPHEVEGLAEGSHAFAVRATRKVRAVDPTPATHGWTIAIPPETAVAGPASPSDSTSASLTFSADDPAATFECSLNGADFEACTSPHLLTELPDGLQELRVRAVDASGNDDPTPAAHAWVVAVPPETLIDGGPPNPSNSTTASFAFSGSDNGTAPSALTFECSLDAGDWGPCTSGGGYADLADGSHTFAVRATDEAGNSDPTPASFAWTIDTIAPETTLDAQPAELSNDSSPHFEFHADDAVGFECRLDAGDWLPCVSGHGYSGLGDGGHGFAVRAVDAAGNVDGTPAAYSWTIDTVAAAATIDSGPSALTNDAIPTFSFSSEAGASLECRVDDAAFEGCASPFTTAPLADGAHTFEVRATDAAGNTGTAASRAFTVDTVAPETAIDGGPSGLTNDATPSFSFSGEAGASVECRVDAAAFAGCESPYTTAVLADGAHTFEVRATDAAGNTGTAASRAFTVDTVAPETAIDSGPAGPTNVATPTFAFSSEEGATFECRVDTGAFAACEPPHTTAALADGGHSFEVRATDPAGNTAGTPASRAFTVDTVAPETGLDAGPAGLGNDATPTFSFSSEAGASLECRVDSAAFAACESPYTTAALTDGVHTFEVRATDVAGNTDGSPAARTFTVDTVAPETLIESGPADVTNDATPSFAFSSEPEASFECRVDAGAYVACDAPYTAGALADGAHAFEVRATDAAGNVDGTPASRAFTVDTVAPETTIDVGPSGLTNDPTPSFSFSGELAVGFECRVDAGAFAGCDSPYTTAVLGDGAHTFEVRGTDAAGNTGVAAARVFTVDTVAPETVLDAGPSGLTGDTTPTFSFSSEASATLECRVDAAAFTACDSPYTSAALADGAHTFEVRATDEAGNTDSSPAARAFTIDTSVDTQIDSGPDGVTNDSTPTFAFSSEAGASFECRVDTAAFAACGTPYTTAALADGGHTFDVRATDGAGNIDGSPASRVFSVDTAAPETAIDAGPTGATNDSTPSFGFSSEAGASFECRVDTAAFAACDSPYTTAALDDGSHAFEVRASDQAGNVDGSPAVRVFTVDTVAPAATIDAGAGGPTNDSTPTFAFSSEPDSSFECRVDAAAFAACESPHTVAALADGAHTFAVRATDGAGNTGSQANRAFTVDTIAPETTIASGPPATTQNTAASFTFAADEAATFECSLDGSAFASCTSPREYADLAVGDHVFRVRAIDAAANTDSSPASQSWTVEPRADVTPPETTIGDRPPATTSSTSATFTFSSSEADSTFACSLDGAAFAACTSPREYTGLAVGDHVFRVRATDAAGNDDSSPASYGWTIQPPPDTTAPDTAITGRPANPSNSASASFAFVGSDNATPQAMLVFQCRLDSLAAAGFVSCSSPRVVSALSEGSHTFEVRAVDLTGNADPTPAGYTWTVDLTAPDTTIGAGPPATTDITSATFSFAAGETGASFQCSLDGAPFAECASPQAYAGLLNGGHQFRVRAVDTAGNVDPTPATYSWTIAPLGTCTPTTVTVPASADSWLLESSPTNNYGADSVLKVDSKSGAHAQLVIRFELPAAPAGCIVANARLRLYASSFKTGRILEALRLGGAWTESGITWTNRPAVVGAAATAASAGGYVEWIVLPQVQSMYTDRNDGFLVRDAVPGGSGIEQNFHSREKGADNPPQLVISFG